MSSPDPTTTFDVFSAACPSREVMQHITGRWGSLTLSALAAGPMRFSALRRRVDGISDRVLSQTLQRLEADGMVVREDHETVPPHVEYELSELGQRVTGSLLDLIGTLEGAMAEVMARRG